MWKIDQEPFEQFESLFEEAESQNNISIGEMQNRINIAFTRNGFRELGSNQIVPSASPQKEMGENVDEIYASVLQALKEGGTVVWYMINNPKILDVNATFGSMRLTQEGEGVLKNNEVIIHIAKYYDGEYDFNESMMKEYDEEAFTAHDILITNTFTPNILMEYVGLSKKATEVVNEDGETEYKNVPHLTPPQKPATFSMWFTDSVYIPQPFNLTFPSWLTKVIKDNLRKAKL